MTHQNLKTPITYAFIDSQNLNLGTLEDVRNAKGKIIYHGKRLNFYRFRQYLRDRYGVSRAYIFIGLIPNNNNLYMRLQSAGFTLVFKPVSYYIDENGKRKPKGNVDTDIVLFSAAILVDEYDKAVFSSGDGDFVSLYDYLDGKKKLLRILVPNRHRFSSLLKKHRSKLAFVGDVPNLFYASKKTRSSGRKSSSLGQPSHGDNDSISSRHRNVNKKGKKMSQQNQKTLEAIAQKGDKK